MTNFVEVEIDLSSRGRVTRNTDGTRAPPVAPTPPTTLPPRPGVRLSRMIALAHSIERAVATGEIRDFAEAARLLNITPARVNQLTRLLWLSPRIVERVLAGMLDLAERDLRAVQRHVLWADQEHAVTAIVAARKTENAKWT